MDHDVEVAGMGVALAGRAGSEGEMGRQEGITMEPMTQMFKQHLRPIQADIEAIKAHGISRQDIQSAVNPVNGAVRVLSARVVALEQR
eukprot:4905100-Pyramimonas_sp.AAC.1